MTAVKFKIQTIDNCFICSIFKECAKNEMECKMLYHRTLLYNNKALYNKKSKKPTLYIVGGINGAGKSTYINKELLPKGMKILNTDSIAKSVGSNIGAGKIVINTLNMWSKTRKSIVWETVLSSRSFFTIVENFKKQNYSIKIIYIIIYDINNIQAFSERIKKRVQEGGHDISKDKLEYRFSNKSRKFNEAIKYSDGWTMYCNQDYKFTEVASGTSEKKKITKPELYNSFNGEPVSELIQDFNNIVTMKNEFLPVYGNYTSVR